MTFLPTLSPESAAQMLRREVAALSPPVDVEKIAWQIGVDQIVIGPIVGDGRLEHKGERTRILVQIRASPARRRFTIAHEVGHLWLQSHRRQNPELPTGGQEEEHFCNAFAAALLMPPAWIRCQAQTEGPSFDQLDQIAGRAEVSLAAALLQLRRYASWKRSLLHWSWDSGNWRLWSTTGIPRGCQRQITSVRETRRAIKHAENLGGRAEIPLLLRIGGEERHVRAEMKVGRGRALALAELEPLSKPAHFGDAYHHCSLAYPDRSTPPDGI